MRRCPLNPLPLNLTLQPLRQAVPISLLHSKSYPLCVLLPFRSYIRCFCSLSTASLSFPRPTSTCRLTLGITTPLFIYFKAHRNHALARIVGHGVHVVCCAARPFTMLHIITSQCVSSAANALASAIATTVNTFPPSTRFSSLRRVLLCCLGARYGCSLPSLSDIPPLPPVISHF